MDDNEHMTTKIDNIDKKILNYLIEDSRASYRQIGKKIKVSAVTVMNRIKRLEKHGVIDKYTIKIAYWLLGYDMQVLIDVKVFKGKVSELSKKIANYRGVYAVYDNTGPFDATILAKFRTRLHLDNFLKKLQSMDFVERTETKLLLATSKEGMMKF